MYITVKELGDKVIEEGQNFIKDGIDCKAIQMVNDVKWVADESFSMYVNAKEIKDTLNYVDEIMHKDGYELYSKELRGTIFSTISDIVKEGKDNYRIDFDVDAIYDSCILKGSDVYLGAEDVYVYLKNR